MIINIAANQNCILPLHDHLQLMIDELTAITTETNLVLPRSMYGLRVSLWILAVPAQSFVHMPTRGSDGVAGRPKRAKVRTWNSNRS